VKRARKKSFVELTIARIADEDHVADRGPAVVEEANRSRPSDDDPAVALNRDRARHLALGVAEVRLVHPIAREARIEHATRPDARDDDVIEPIGGSGDEDPSVALDRHIGCAAGAQHQRAVA
jgi:hypothetical protein